LLVPKNLAFWDAIKLYNKFRTWTITKTNGRKICVTSFYSTFVSETEKNGLLFFGKYISFVFFSSIN